MELRTRGTLTAAVDRRWRSPATAGKWAWRAEAGPRRAWWEAGQRRASEGRRQRRQPPRRVPPTACADRGDRGGGGRAASRTEEGRGVDEASAAAGWRGRGWPRGWEAAAAAEKGRRSRRPGASGEPGRGGIEEGRGVEEASAAAGCWGRGGPRGWEAAAAEAKGRRSRRWRLYGRGEKKKNGRGWAERFYAGGISTQ
ncbi:LOW QUALITY PROTEIN: hypothetical protein BRADI_2g35743v3 [Brachypodium distachyon]|uniref:Uncharacterized protein n=1 Tax=Brachypodium distachyon TaxID=15368 RepID=A0A2K2DC15_BRADI|nr:LOW QUALITY PROTEIN: hypothetical protein BRADI_2g35743v3 [Brachypodium distachyon]